MHAVLAKPDVTLLVQLAQNAPSVVCHVITPKRIHSQCEWGIESAIPAPKIAAVLISPSIQIRELG